MLFVAHKPPNISSNAFLSTLKRRFCNKTLGFSGTLDPFASGVLVVASDKHARLFSHFNLSPKVYIATLWLGAQSPTLDISGISRVCEISAFDLEQIQSIVESLKGKITYTPPKFSAKKIKGIRAYDLARQNADFVLEPCEMEIFDIAILNYNHPFLSFKVSVSKGAYIRSLGEIIAHKLGITGTLSSLRREKEGDFIFENYKMLNVLDFLPYPKLQIPHLKNAFLQGKKLNANDLGITLDLPNLNTMQTYESKKNQNAKNSANFSDYIAIFDDFFSIIHIENYGAVKYILNRIDLC